MMPDLGKYTLHVLLAYGATLGALLALALATWARSRAVRRRLAEAEARRGTNG
ncbi:MAG: heme exporter protein CcmD [Pseudooceanicola sp.]|nr:heme exporter protein CcmD [Pseudooceanicola sp.]